MLVLFYHLAKRNEEIMPLGECSICGGKNVPVRKMPPYRWLEPGIPDYQCTDALACDERYDEETRDGGWLW